MMNRLIQNVTLPPRYCATCVVLLISMTSSPHTAFAQIITFNDPTPTSEGGVNTGDGFGWSVAVDDNHVLVGAPFDDTLGKSVGQAHLFKATTGELLHTFDIPDNGGGRFGYAVALDGNHALIGAYGRGTQEGAYLFDITTGDLLQSFYDPTTTERAAQFGKSLAIDGNFVLVGARYDSTLGIQVGQAHLFDITTGDLLHTFNDPTPQEYGYFGSRVAVDGNLVLVDADLFDATTGNLLYSFADPAPTTGIYDSYADSIAIDGNRVLIGDWDDKTRGEVAGLGVGQAYLFDANTGDLIRTFNHPVEGGTGFGYRVAMDENRILVAGLEDGTEQIHLQVYSLDANTGDLLATFEDPNPHENNPFGFGESLAIDGVNVLIGDPHDGTLGVWVGQAYLFSIQEIPEPGSCALLTLGLATLAFARRLIAF